MPSPINHTEDRLALVTQQRDRLLAAAEELLEVWDASSDALGPEWNALSELIERLRAAV